MDGLEGKKEGGKKGDRDKIGLLSLCFVCYCVFWKSVSCSINSYRVRLPVSTVCLLSSVFNVCVYIVYSVVLNNCLLTLSSLNLSSLAMGYAMIYIYVYMYDI